MWKEEKGVPVVMFPVVAGRTTLLPFTSACFLFWCSPPNTEPNEGIGMNDRALV
jgi:hypothetical protein